MNLSDFDFDLPAALIATRPVKPRVSARLLVAQGTQIQDCHVSDLISILGPKDRLVLNNTRVIPARLSAQRHRAGAIARIEVTLMEIDAEATALAPEHTEVWRAMARPLRKVHEGETIVFEQGLSARVVRKSAQDLSLAFNQTGEDLQQTLAQIGVMPLPPYIAAKRAPDSQDTEDYQTVFARHRGAVAAPTASLHFDHALLAALSKKGVAITEVTLHVGAGTFLPVVVEDVKSHKMHAEWGEVTEQAAQEINATRMAGGRIIPVGTTALRLIESAAAADGTLRPWRGATDIFIYPGYQFRVTDALMTNFHLPKSTLMMLVAALMGPARITKIYDHAVRHNYRFFSYGDASLLIP